MGSGSPSSSDSEAARCRQAHRRSRREWRRTLAPCKSVEHADELRDDAVLIFVGIEFPRWIFRVERLQANGARLPAPVPLDRIAIHIGYFPALGQHQASGSRPYHAVTEHADRTI